MGEITVQVPAEYSDDFRVALVGELAFDISGLENDRKRLADPTERYAELVDRDYRDHMRQFQRDVALAERVELELGAGAVKFTMPATSYNLDTITQTYERIARDVVAPNLIRELDTTPIEEEQADRVKALTDELVWALDKATELYGAYFEAKDQEMAA